MALTTLVAGQVIRASTLNANFALCVLTDTARTVTVTHTYTASQTFSGGWTAGAACTVTVASATAFCVGLAGATNPAFQVDSSTASSATGVKVKSAAAAGGVAVSVISSGTNENLTIDAKGSGTVTINATGTGGIVLSRATTISAGGLAFTGGATLGQTGAFSGITTLAVTTSATAPYYTSGNTGSVANDGVATLEATARGGMLHIRNTGDDGTQALILVRAGSGTTSIVSQPFDAVFSNTKDNASTVNVYVEGGALKVQNKRGSAQTYQWWKSG